MSTMNQQLFALLVLHRVQPAARTTGASAPVCARAADDPAAAG